MPQYFNGFNTFLGVTGTTTLTPASGVTSATINLGGFLTTWDIQAPVNGALTINNTAAVESNLNITTNGSSVTLDSSVLAAGAIGSVDTTINGGTFTIGANLITANILTSASVTFAAPGGTNIVGTPGSFLTLNLLTAFAPYQGFTSNADNIDDVSLAFSKFQSYTISGSNDDQTITVSDSDGTFFRFRTTGSNLTDGTYTNTSTGPLRLTLDSHGGTNITLCFFNGTHIRTSSGEVPVEALRAGDAILTVDGRALPIRWIGTKKVATRFSDPLRTLPIRIRAGALADSVPARDLLVSPDHAIFIEGILVQAGALVNGVSIIRETNVPATFTYYHVELESHSLILAEGTPTETFVDNVDRMAFDNWSEHQAFFGDDSPIAEMDYPRAKSARQIPRNIRALIEARKHCFVGKISTAA